MVETGDSIMEKLVLEDRKVFESLEQEEGVVKIAREVMAEMDGESEPDARIITEVATGGTEDEEIKNYIAKATGAAGELTKRVFSQIGREEGVETRRWVLVAFVGLMLFGGAAICVAKSGGPHRFAGDFVQIAKREVFHREEMSQELAMEQLVKAYLEKIKREGGYPMDRALKPLNPDSPEMMVLAAYGEGGVGWMYDPDDPELQERRKEVGGKFGEDLSEGELKRLFTDPDAVRGHWKKIAEAGEIDEETLEFYTLPADELQKRVSARWAGFPGFPTPTP